MCSLVRCTLMLRQKVNIASYGIMLILMCDLLSTFLPCWLSSAQHVLVN